MSDRRGSLLLVLLAVLLAGCSPIAGFPPGWLLEHPRGPYRGKVVDAETGEGIGGAAVLAVWDHQYWQVVESNRDYWDAREVVTRADGTFVLDARDIEERAGKTVWRPRFIIYSPGYGYFPAYQASPRSPQPGLFEGSGATVELRKLRTREERLRAIRALPPLIPRKKIPTLLRLIDSEYEALGLR